MNHLKTTCILIVLLVITNTGYTQKPQAIAFKNGHWFTGDGFDYAMFYSKIVHSPGINPLELTRRLT